jgi:hypothetical protein
MGQSEGRKKVNSGLMIQRGRPVVKWELLSPKMSKIKHIAHHEA